jgi:hypothetical protein
VTPWRCTLAGDGGGSSYAVHATNMKDSLLAAAMLVVAGGCKDGSWMEALRL